MAESSDKFSIQDVLSANILFEDDYKEVESDNEYVAEPFIYPEAHNRPN